MKPSSHPDVTALPETLNGSSLQPDGSARCNVNVFTLMCAMSCINAAICQSPTTKTLAVLTALVSLLGVRVFAVKRQAPNEKAEARLPDSAASA